MEDYKREFISLCLQHEALRFGEFTLKSGRVSPYFFNAGQFSSGASLRRLGACYAMALRAHALDIDMLFGPAYKGIPVACATAIALQTLYGLDIPVGFDRKEPKDHGEGGLTLGAPLEGRVLILDDVLTAGTSIRHAVQLIAAHGARCAGALIALDRQERGVGSGSAAQEVEQEFGFAVNSILTLEDLLAFLAEEPRLRDHLERMQAYQSTYGCSRNSI